MKTLINICLCALLCTSSCSLFTPEIEDLTTANAELVKYWLVGTWKYEYEVDPYQYRINPSYNPKENAKADVFGYTIDYFNNGTSRIKYSYPRQDSIQQGTWSIEETKDLNTINRYRSKWLFNKSSHILKLTKDTLVFGTFGPHGTYLEYLSNQ